MKLTQAAEGLLEALAANTVDAAHLALATSVRTGASRFKSCCVKADHQLTCAEGWHSTAFRIGADVAK